MTAKLEHPVVRVALIGSGRMGAFHAQTLAHRLRGATLAAVADPAPGAAEKLAAALAAPRAYTDPAQVFADPEVDAVVIAAPARFHADLVVAAAAAGKGIFCEKPMAITLADADRAIAAARSAGVVLQVGFNRRFAPDWSAARELLDSGRLGTPRLLRSVTRDPGGFDPSRVAPNTIFLETLIHDFDTLRFLNPGAGRSRCTPQRTPSSNPNGGTAACSTPPSWWCVSTTGPPARRRPASRPPTGMTSAARSSVPAEWRPWEAAGGPG